MKSKEEQEEVIDITETRREVSTQTEPLPELISCGVQVEQLPVPAITRDFANQFPQDASVEVRNDHSYARGEEPQCQLLVRQEREDQSETEETVIEDSSRCVDSTEQVEELCSSQYSETTNPVASQSEYYPSDSEDECFKSQQSTQNESEENSVNFECRLFLVYEEQLKELYRFCPKCGSFTVDAHEIQNEGSQLSIHLTCQNGCSYKWQSQPPLSTTKGRGNLALTAAIFFSGIHFAKFERFAHCLKLKTISESSYYVLRKRFVFPVVERAWQTEQASVSNELVSRPSNVLVGDGRCDSPGHCAKYCTYTLMDIDTCKVVDFKVVSVSQVANSNVMEIKGFKEVLNSVENQGIRVSVISTDRHPQIRKEMRTNHPDNEHQFDPWHLAKSISKKLASASNKTGCRDLKPWIPSVINHLWWSATTCVGNAQLLKEKWVSLCHHVTNRHEWPGNQFYHKCAHQPYLPEAARRKKWLKPGSPAHQALVSVVKDKGLLKDMEHLTKCVHTTILEVYHSMYLKYLPKQMHYTHEVMEKGTMLAALDHNKNVKRPQVSQPDIDRLRAPLAML